MKRFIAPALLGVFSLTACQEKICTAKGCQSQVQVTFDADDGTALGRYVVSVQADDETFECQFTRGPDAGAGGAANGGAGGATGENTVIDARCTASEINGVLEIQGTLRFEGFTVSNSTWTKTPPRKVSFDVRLDGVSVKAGSFEPEFEKYYPNGEECGDACNVAQHEVSLSAE